MVCKRVSMTHAAKRSHIVIGFQRKGQSRMKSLAQRSSARDKLLFTPGPLTTSLAVKQAMLHDAGSWHFEFNAVVHRIRESLLRLAGLECGCWLRGNPDARKRHVRR